jgi:hypothetical protein
MSLTCIDLSALIEAYLARRLDVDMPIKGVVKFASLAELRAAVANETTDYAIATGNLHPRDALIPPDLDNETPLRAFVSQLRRESAPRYRGPRLQSPRRAIRARFALPSARPDEL